MKIDTSKILTRLASGIIYIGLMLGSYFCGMEYFFIFSCLLAVIAVCEFTQITQTIKKTNIPLLILDILATICIIAFLGYGWSILPWIGVLLIRIPAQLYYTHENPVKALSLSIFKQVYIGIGLGSMCALAEFPNWILAILFFIWINDTGAYIVGTAIGRHRLFERISPKKSWEGFFGGFILTLIAAALFSTYLHHWFGIPQDYIIWLCLGGIVVIFATWGDLVESQLKRTLNIKDSGNLIPGHGGILDRIDSILLAMPAANIIMNLLI